MILKLDYITFYWLFLIVTYYKMYQALFFIAASSNLHDIYLRNFDDDSSSDDGSDISVDQISLTEKSLSARTSRAQLSTLDEVCVIPQ